MKTNQGIQSLLQLNGLRLWPVIGCTPEEKTAPQPVLVDLSIRFARPPTGCETDQLEDTLCYAQMSNTIGELVRKRPFQLIENLTREIYCALLPLLPAGSNLAVKVTKEKPPIRDLTGGASFTYGNF